MSIRINPILLLLALVGISGCIEDSDQETVVDLCKDVVCSPEQCQKEGLCDPKTGECVYEDEKNGTSCDDDDACTYGDRCEDGQCEGADQVVCRALDDCHEAGVCDHETGCSHPVKADQPACGDNNACTINDRCVAGVCTGNEVVCEPVDDCHLAGECNPGTGLCSTPEKPDGSLCDAGNNNLCEKSQCRTGVCETVPVICKAMDDCHLSGVCDSETGQCSNPQKANGSDCDNGNLCTEDDICQAGNCVAGGKIECEPLDQCHTAGVCDSEAGCTNPAKTDGSDCNDNDACTQLDQCVQGECLGSDPVVCTPLDTCHRTGICNSATGLCSDPPVDDGVLCDDGNACTENTTCVEGECVGGNTVVCQAMDQCHLPGECDSESGCSDPQAPDDTECDDGDQCTQVDECQSGMCIGEDPVVCEPLNQCYLAGECDSLTGICSDIPKQNGTVCDDGDLCTLQDICTGGQCASQEEVVCDLDCLEQDLQYCEPSTGQCIGTPMANGSPCEDGDPCSMDDECQTGICQPGAPVACSSIGTCYDAGFCDSASGDCTNPQTPDQPSCSQGLCFADITEQVGLIWHNANPISSHLGASVTVLDVDNDGWLDVLLVGDGGIGLYRNSQGSSFEDITPGSGLPYTVPGGILMAASSADYDNDGDSDVFLVSRVGNRLFRNNGDMTFSDVTGQAGLENTAWCLASSFGDFDKDGWLDLYVGCYIKQSNPPNHVPYANELYRNIGDGTFSNVTEDYGVGGNGTTLAVAWSDYDNDGWVDLLVCNDFGQTVAPNKIYRNMGAGDPDPSGWFDERAGSIGADLAIRCQGVAAGDYDRDGDLDYYFSTVGANLLLQNNGGTFTDVADSVTKLEVDACLSGELTSSWGSGFRDFNYDGWLDLYVGCGHNADPYAPGNSLNSPNATLLHQGAALTFTDVSLSAGVGDSRWSRGAAFFDFDNDGDIDVLQANANGSPVLFRNDDSGSNGWVGIALTGRLSNRDGIGAKAWVQTSSFELFEELSVYGFEASSDKRLYFGLGSETEAASMEIGWPSGVVQTLLHIPPATLLSLIEPLVSAQITSPGSFSVDTEGVVPIEISMQNHAEQDLMVNYSIEILVNLSSYAGSTGTQMVSAGAAQSVLVDASMPAGQNGDAEIIVTVWDVQYAEDQDSVSGSINP